jgi:hypothetical protein
MIRVGSCKRYRLRFANRELFFYFMKRKKAQGISIFAG